MGCRLPNGAAVDLLQHRLISSHQPPDGLGKEDQKEDHSFVQLFRLTITLIQIGAKGDVQPLETGWSR
jgi:hypothetical protein